MRLGNLFYLGVILQCSPVSEGILMKENKTKTKTKKSVFLQCLVKKYSVFHLCVLVLSGS